MKNILEERVLVDSYELLAIGWFVFPYAAGLLFADLLASSSVPSFTS
jgi:hypothetical protein